MTASRVFSVAGTLPLAKQSIVWENSRGRTRLPMARRLRPTAKVRTKAQVVDFSWFDGTLEGASEWGFDGSSTRRADGHNSDLVSKPVRLYENPYVEDDYLVVSEVMNRDGSPHSSNARALLDEAAGEEFWFG